MRMIPSSPPSHASNAERKVFYALKSCRVGNETVCLHSLGLPHHSYKACCELDFVLVGPDGLLALEVKGGGVARNASGEWIMTDRRGAEHRHREGPFRQVQGNMFALLELLKRHLPISEIDSLPKGWGVVLPDCAFDTKSVEWDDATIADQPRMAQFPVWLENLLRYNRKKAGRDAAYRAPPELLRRITDLLRPQFEKVPSLAGALDTVEMTLTSLTDDQCRAVDVLAANPRVLCSGGAGTGKTFLAMELARRALADNRHVTLCCSSPWLRNYLDARLSHPELQVVSIAQARKTISRLAPTDLLIADEAQDLMNFEDLDVLDKLLRNGLAQGNWAFFFDSNNQTGLVGRWDPNALQLLESHGATHVPLSRNCRNTRPIVDEVRRFTGCDMGRKDEGEGPRVEVIETRTTESAVSALHHVINRLLDEGVMPSHITILSPRQWSESSVARLPDDMRRQVVRMDDFSLRAFPPPKISFAGISDFKGLENSAIILTDLTAEHLRREEPSVLYVGMSRAKAYLVMILERATD
jgi:hypothetical protein